MDVLLDAVDVLELLLALDVLLDVLLDFDVELEARLLPLEVPELDLPQPAVTRRAAPRRPAANRAPRRCVEATRPDGIRMTPFLRTQVARSEAGHTRPASSGRVGTSTRPY